MNKNCQRDFLGMNLQKGGSVERERESAWREFSNRRVENGGGFSNSFNLKI